MTKRQLIQQVIELKPDTTQIGCVIQTQVLDDLIGQTGGLAAKTIQTVQLTEDGRYGNHYHVKGLELILCLSGQVNVYLVDPEDLKNQTVMILNPGQGLVVPAGIAHAIENLPKSRQPSDQACACRQADQNSTHAMLLIFSSSFPREDDNRDFDAASSNQSVM
ncbi:cupin domain-containing protein [Patescibacteria group bacterium]|nr:cupin domain-containing protein [Patescibacteria group bacterium]MBU1705442.1 cupin domain-containing protein [Patescibacteria group bacterium]